MSESELVSVRMWEVFSPPPLNSIKGSVIPKFLTKRRRRRKISIEVHKITPKAPPTPTSSRSALVSGGSTKSYEECIIRILYQERGKDSKRMQQDEDFCDADDDDLSQSTEDSSVASLFPEYLDQGDYAIADSPGWKVKWRFPITALTIKGFHRTVVIVKIWLGDTMQLRELIFDSVGQAEDFRHELERQQERDILRKEMRLQAQVGDKFVIGEEQITFLVEIVSARNLPVGDAISSDPFVKCSFNGSIIHQTKYIPKTLFPIWTLDTDSLFLWTVSEKQLFLSEGLHCFVLDFDQIGAADVLGWISVPPLTLHEAKGERLEFKLLPPPRSSENEVPGYLVIRCRRASEYDKQFMKEYAEAQSESTGPLSLQNITKLATESARGSRNVATMLRHNSRIVRDLHNLSGIKQYRVRPGPDPDRVHETTWLPPEMIEAECKRDSFKWVESGTGQLGRLFVEILGCDDLPNLDIGGYVGNKTDAFVSLVYEDTVVTTDVIDDCLSPRWMPWSKRAFIFHIYHSSSQLFLGVFDYDNMHPGATHDRAGRVTVDLSNLRKDTIYTLKYNIYTTARMSERKCNGTVTIRLRLDIADEQLLLLSTLEPPEPIYVHSKRRKDFLVVKYTCGGQYDMERYNINVLNSYIEELLAFQNVFFHVGDAIISLLLWRGTTTVSVRGIALRLPLHSLTAFVSAVTLVEQPHVLPSFILFCVAWLLLATMEYRQQLPDVWSRCKSYSELVRILCLGDSGSAPDNIAAYANYEEARRFQEEWIKRMTDAEIAAAKAYEESARIQEEYSNEMEGVSESDTEAAAPQGGISVDPFKPLLYPVQKVLAMVVRYMRHVKFVVVWEECYISFWVVTGCLLLAVIFLFIPWVFLIKWSARLVVWTLFGPWMKLLDHFYVSKIEPPTDEEIEAHRQKEREKRQYSTSAAITEARIKQENSVKMEAMKKFIFGKFITRVPILKEDRYRDVPLPESTAVPFIVPPIAGAPPIAGNQRRDALYKRISLPGQHLVGDMVPKIEPYRFDETPVSPATAHHLNVPVSERKDNGSGFHSGLHSSSFLHYFRVGCVAVTIAATITRFSAAFWNPALKPFLALPPRLWGKTDIIRADVGVATCPQSHRPNKCCESIDFSDGPSCPYLGGDAAVCTGIYDEETDTCGDSPIGTTSICECIYNQTP